MTGRIEVHNASELRLTFAGHPDYSIWVPETVEVTLPPIAVSATATDKSSHDQSLGFHVSK